MKIDFGYLKRKPKSDGGMFDIQWGGGGCGLYRRDCSKDLDDWQKGDVIMIRFKDFATVGGHVEFITRILLRNGRRRDGYLRVNEDVMNTELAKAL